MITITMKTWLLDITVVKTIEPMFDYNYKYNHYSDEDGKMMLITKKKIRSDSTKRKLITIKDRQSRKTSANT